MDPVLTGALAAVAISIVGGAVRTVRLVLDRRARVELARIADRGLTRRARAAAHTTAVRERSTGHRWTSTPAHPSGGGPDGRGGQR
ncbi:hypothetical protein ACFVIM_17295 [Streptomyces sp. NPDC057638]|uniref:hypothetical protein n=1 Tax=Streptomyces sp. NPDC057638 TaxID=3346190 RepID=UPI003686B80A